MFTPEEMKQSALEGLAIAEKATEGPWVRGMYEDGEQSEGPTGVHPGSRGEWAESKDVITKPTDEEPDGVVIAEAALTEDDASFIADSRTRAPAAYRNVIALAKENERLRDAVDGWAEIETERDTLRASLEEAKRVIDRATADRIRILVGASELEGHVHTLITEIWQAAKRAGIANDVPPDGPNAIQFVRLMADRIEEMTEEIADLRMPPDSAA